MRSALIIGSGPAAAGAALALTAGTGVQVTVIDIGGRLEESTQVVVDRLSEEAPTRWSDADLAVVSRQPVPSGRALPEKRSYGSDFPFRDVGQLTGITTDGQVNRSVVSGAYGGFSNVWGSQFVPYSRATLARWPLGFDDLAPHYKAILDSVPLAAEEDDLADQFPLIAARSSLPPPAPRTIAVLERYRKHRARLNQMGITMGKARLAFSSDGCVRCGLCMTGCPYSLIYSAAQTFDELRERRRIVYHNGLQAFEMGENARGAWVDAIELSSGRVVRFVADRVFVACGVVGTTRLVLHSLHRYDTDVTMGESVQFVLPFISHSGGPDPRLTSDFTLNQFNMLVSPEQDEAQTSLFHFYSYNPAIVDALPGLLRRDYLGSTGQLLQRLSVALGYLPSWTAPRLVLRASAPTRTAPGAELHLSREPTAWARHPLLRTVLGRVARSARMLDLWPLIPAIRIAEGAKSYHIGGSFPHTGRPGAGPASDLLGRVAPWRRIHLVDASVFPDVPATTFTFTIMANAHRIASEAASES